MGHYIIQDVQYIIYARRYIQNILYVKILVSINNGIYIYTYIHIDIDID